LIRLGLILLPREDLTGQTLIPCHPIMTMRVTQGHIMPEDIGSCQAPEIALRPTTPDYSYDLTEPLTLL
jgi:hypothetical protein